MPIRLWASVLLALAGCSEAVPPPPPYPSVPGPVAELHSPAYTFRAMDHSSPDVFVNGRKRAALPLPWWVSGQTDFDPLIPVTDWPPKGAAFRGSAKWVSEDGRRSTLLELWIAGGRFTDLDGLRKRWPHLDPAEHVFFVQASLPEGDVRGAVRVKVVAADGAVYRYVSFDPSSGDEDPQASRHRRTVWFERD